MPDVSGVENWDVLRIVNIAVDLSKSLKDILVEVYEKCISYSMAISQVKQIVIDNISEPFPLESERLKLDNNTKDVWNDILEDI